ncbi:MAG: 4Fe-4S dicluster domain-containing protein [Candidatus Lokiarchaeota archaeon]|nr:4Fe-4S dicluster domain-containing protein [Candidatus Lokiarchaeota archaeon]MBD3199456.1 4Fe-4S dicluster domain-containing protein [Candidatus Lokiarchaeota archaeon]
MATIDFEFRNQIIQNDIGSTLAYCYQCATCSGACPVAQVTQGRYNPRRLILDALLGLKERMFGPEHSFDIWGCTVCDTCDEVCPQKVELTEIFTILKNMSVERGEAPEYYTAQASTILEFGKAIPMQSAIERRRDQLGLPKILAPDAKEVQKILKLTKLPEKLPKKEE